MSRKDQEPILLTLQQYDRKEPNPGQVSYLVGPTGLKKYATHEDGKQWIPASLMTDYQELGRNLVSFKIPQWLAKNKGFYHDGSGK